LDGDLRKAKEQVTAEQTRSSSLEQEKIRLNSELSETSNRMRQAEDTLNSTKSQLAVTEQDRDRLKKKIDTFLEK